MLWNACIELPMPSSQRWSMKIKGTGASWHRIWPSHITRHIIPVQPSVHSICCTSTAGGRTWLSSGGCRSVAVVRRNGPGWWTYRQQFNNQSVICRQPIGNQSPTVGNLSAMVDNLSATHRQSERIHNSSKMRCSLSQLKLQKCMHQLYESQRQRNQLYPGDPSDVYICRWNCKTNMRDF